MLTVPSPLICAGRCTEQRHGPRSCCWAASKVEKWGYRRVGGLTARGRVVHVVPHGAHRRAGDITARPLSIWRTFFFPLFWSWRSEETNLTIILIFDSSSSEGRQSLRAVRAMGGVGAARRRRSARACACVRCARCTLCVVSRRGVSCAVRVCCFLRV